MRTLRNLLILTAATSLFFSSCTEENVPVKKSLTLPASYVSMDYDTNTYQERELSQLFSAMLAAMKAGENPAITLDLNTLLSAWNEGGSKSLNARAVPMGTEVENIRLPEMVKHSGNTYHPDYGDTATIGGVFQSRLLNEGAFEIGQGIDKGAYAGLFLYQILELHKGEFNQKTLDRMLALYGAHPSFPNTPTAANTGHPDKYIANYASRRDKNEGSGFYTRIKTEFLTLQAAMNAGDEYKVEKEESFARLIHNMEMALAATSVNYMNSAISKLSQTNPTDADKAAALHDLSEAFGFLQGFSNLNSPYITITNEQIQTLQAFLQFDGQDYSFYKFTNDPVNTLPELVKAINKLQEIYAFSPAEMNDFKTNWVSAQGR
ncbi:MAG: DUF4856 domain-containing protein [Bacteroidia bacterium]